MKLRDLFMGRPPGEGLSRRRMLGGLLTAIGLAAVPRGARAGNISPFGLRSPRNRVSYVDPAKKYAAGTWRGLPIQAGANGIAVAANRAYQGTVMVAGAAPFAMNDIQFAYAHFMGNSNGTSGTGNPREVPFTDGVVIECASCSFDSGATWNQITFDGGSPGWTVDTVALPGGKKSDNMHLATPTTPNCPIWHQITWHYPGANGSTTWIFGGYQAATNNLENFGGKSTTMSTEVLAGGAINFSGVLQGSTQVYGPAYMICSGHSATGDPVWCVLGDSLAQSKNESEKAQWAATKGILPGNPRNTMGYIQRMLDDNTVSRRHCYMTIAVPSQSVIDWAADVTRMTRKLALMNLFSDLPWTHFAYEEGRNAHSTLTSYVNAGSGSYRAGQANAYTVMKGYFPSAVFMRMSLSPYNINSTDGFKTLAGQTGATGASVYSAAPDTDDTHVIWRDNEDHESLTGFFRTGGYFTGEPWKVWQLWGADTGANRWKWKPRTKEAVISAAGFTSGSLPVTVDSPPVVGDAVTLDPAGIRKEGVVATVTPLSGNDYLVSVTWTGGAPGAQSAGVRVVLGYYAKLTTAYTTGATLSIDRMAQVGDYIVADANLGAGSFQIVVNCIDNMDGTFTCTVDGNLTPSGSHALGAEITSSPGDAGGIHPSGVSCYLAGLHGATNFKAVQFA